MGSLWVFDSAMMFGKRVLDINMQSHTVTHNIPILQCNCCPVAKFSSILLRFIVFGIKSVSPKLNLNIN